MPVFKARVFVETIYEVCIEAKDSGDAYVALDVLEASELKDGRTPYITNFRLLHDLCGCAADFDADELLKRE